MVRAAVANMEERLIRLRRAMREAKLGALLVSSPENRRYFSGFQAGDPLLNESSGSLLVTPRRLWLLTDSRYVEEAATEAPACEVLDAARQGLGETVKKLLGPGKSVSFEPERLTVADYLRLKKSLAPGAVEPCPFDPSELRISKEPGELALITKALRITEEAIGRLFSDLEGKTEAEAAWALDSDFRNLGGEGPAFETIVAAGPRASLPHAVPGPRKIKRTDMVVVDCGARYNGYASDITRTWAGPDLAPWQKEIYRIVREAQLAAIKVLAPGRTGLEVDKAARDVIERAGYGEYFGHGLGHGVGLAVHEAPRLSKRGLNRIPAGAVVTVEPGIYLPGKGGVRLEQLVHVSADGPKVLNRDKSFYDF